jgi:hypothetical protein
MNKYKPIHYTHTHTYWKSAYRDSKNRITIRKLRGKRTWGTWMGWLSSPGVISSNGAWSFVNFTYRECAFPSAVWPPQKKQNQTDEREECEIRETENLKRRGNGPLEWTELNIQFLRDSHYLYHPNLEQFPNSETARPPLTIYIEGLKRRRDGFIFLFLYSYWMPCYFFFTTLK